MIRFQALPTSEIRALQSGGPDFYGHPPEVTVSDGTGTPCRHCLNDTPKGENMLILSYRPFPSDQPYAEVGPIFLCADVCASHKPSGQLPQILTTSVDYLIKGYSSDDRIVYGTGQVVTPTNLTRAAIAIFKDASVAYIHVRSARNNCYQCKIMRI